MSDPTIGDVYELSNLNKKGIVTLSPHSKGRYGFSTREGDEPKHYHLTNPHESYMNGNRISAEGLEEITLNKDKKEAIKNLLRIRGLWDADETELKIGKIYDVEGIYKGGIKALYIGKFNRNTLVNRHAIVYPRERLDEESEATRNTIEICRFSGHSFENGKLIINKRYITSPDTEQQKDYLENKLKKSGIIDESWQRGWV